MSTGRILDRRYEYMYGGDESNYRKNTHGKKEDIYRWVERSRDKFVTYPWDIQSVQNVPYEAEHFCKRSPTKYIELCDEEDTY